MPKMKTNSGAKKRFKLKKSGVIKRNKQNHRHILTNLKIEKEAWEKQLMLRKLMKRTLKQCLVHKGRNENEN